MVALAEPTDTASLLHRAEEHAGHALAIVRTLLYSSDRATAHQLRDVELSLGPAVARLRRLTSAADGARRRDS